MNSICCKYVTSRVHRFFGKPHDELQIPVQNYPDIIVAGLDKYWASGRGRYLRLFTSFLFTSVRTCAYPINGLGMGSIAVSARCIARSSAFLLPLMPECPATQVILTWLATEISSSAFQHQSLSFLRAFSVSIESLRKS